jgi:hypothetical protein
MQKLFENQPDMQCFNEVHEIFRQPPAQCVGSHWSTEEIAAHLPEPLDDATITEHDEPVDQSLVNQALMERMTLLESLVK